MCILRPMYIDTAQSTRGDKTYVRYLLRDSYREDNKVKHRTIANLGQCNKEEIAAMKLAFKHKGDLTALGSIGQIQLKQGSRFGAVWALKQVADRLGLTQALGQDYNGTLALWQVFARIINQGSRLSAMRLAQSHAVSEVLGLDNLKKDHLYQNLTWLSENQESIEKKIWQIRCDKQTTTSELFLYDVTSSYLEGEKNDLAAYGYNRDGKKSKKQIVIGLLTDAGGAPVAVRVFEGNTSDTKTVSEQTRTLAENFNIKEVTLVGDRGMLKTPQIEALPDGFRYITAIAKPQMRTMLQNEVIQPGLFDEKLHEVVSEGVRYLVRRNPIRTEEIRANRERKFDAVCKKSAALTLYLAKHPKAKLDTAKKHIQSKIDKLKIQTFVEVVVDEKTKTISVTKNEESLKDVAFLDGVYIIKTDVPQDKASAQTIHDRYKDLSKVESAFRTMKTGHLETRPIYVRKDPRTRGHVFVVMLAYLIVQELERCWKESNMTLQEGIDELGAISLVYMMTSKTMYLKIPEPTQRAAPLFASANLILPQICLQAKRVVPTNKVLH
jgi:transposase